MKCRYCGKQLKADASKRRGHGPRCEASRIQRQLNASQLFDSSGNILKLI